MLSYCPSLFSFATCTLFDWSSQLLPKSHYSHLLHTVFLLTPSSLLSTFQLPCTLPSPNMLPDAFTLSWLSHQKASTLQLPSTLYMKQTNILTVSAVKCKVFFFVVVKAEIAMRGRHGHTNRGIKPQIYLCSGRVEAISLFSMKWITS